MEHFSSAVVGAFYVIAKVVDALKEHIAERVTEQRGISLQSDRLPFAGDEQQWEQSEAYNAYGTSIEGKWIRADCVGGLRLVVWRSSHCGVCLAAEP